MLAKLRLRDGLVVEIDTQGVRCVDRVARGFVERVLEHEARGRGHERLIAIVESVARSIGAELEIVDAGDEEGPDDGRVY